MVRARWIGLLAAAAVVVLRQPAFFTAPRFWAEEGSVYYVHALTHPWWQTLVLAPVGYLTLYTGLAAVAAAHLVSVEQAPLVTTLAAFALQFVALALVAFGRAPEWRDGRWLVGLAIVLFAGFTDEIWLTTTNAGFYWLLIACLLLLEPDDVRGVRSATYRALLAVALLSSPAASFLAPLYVVRAWRARTREAVIQAGIVVAATCVQVLSLATFVRPSSMPSRSQSLDVATVTCAIWIKAVALPTLGETARLWVLRLPMCQEPPLTSAAIWAGALVAFVVWIGLAAWLGAGLPPGRRFTLAAAYVLVTTLSIVGSLGDKRILLHFGTAASRYGYTPSVLLLVLLLGNVRRPIRIRTVVGGALLTVGLVLGALRYPYTVRWHRAFPQWRTEVAARRRNPSHVLQIWPPGWSLVLPPSSL